MKQKMGKYEVRKKQIKLQKIFVDQINNFLDTEMAIMFLTIDVLASKKIHIILIFWAIGILQKCKKVGGV